ncbi:MAG: glyoxalase [Rhodospirillaceae bacterium]|jgi:catechol 2,3-dioxygenase-like lactoylglutathione lyase family enzyme|nr:glyoxalase [Rhodospirillaceae bacterium]MBT5943178.1 glyoxalase [Rhodospirillaceae bacterium]MBT6405590.1 glyoxalase [Rhodospirillaceae bacterium]MBT6534616.1 glyoxalase [Rhodospirillaceae bacterium]MBT7360966.1 glyoxalase [Rhodospirillaceae bacterium]
MSLSTLDHCSIRTVKLDETRDFYVDILGMTDGDRPDFDFPGNWLYVDGKPVVHLVGVDPDDPSGLIEYLGGDVDASKLDGSGGSGAFDHVAFRAKNPEMLIARLEDRGVRFRERKVPDLDLFQIFIEDPNGITVELNYFADEQVAA